MFCPKSIKACALRLTRLNVASVALDPLAARSRIQTAAFVELGLTPDLVVGKEVVVKSSDSTAVATSDREQTVLMGLECELKLCGVPYSVLEMLIGVEPLGPGENPYGAVLQDAKAIGGNDLVAVEVWSQNAGSTGLEDPWVQWVLPRTLRWDLSGSLSFNNGTLEVSLKGYAEANPSWVPSYPGPSFPSWVAGGGDPDGWPVGPLGPVLPEGVAADEWTLDDQARVQRGGPLGFRFVSALPAPLDGCDYAPSKPCDPPFTDPFTGDGALGAPWTVPLVPVEVGG